MMHLLFGFDGRMRRLHYWLASFGAGFALSVFYLAVFMILFGIASTTGDVSAAMSSPGMIIALLLLTLVYLVFAFWVSLAVQIKRWHDRDKSGWWVLINFVPFIGGIWALIECGFLEGTKGPNKFGPDPLAQTATA